MTKSLDSNAKTRHRTTTAPCSHVDRQYSEWAGCPICGVRELNFGQTDKADKAEGTQGLDREEVISGSFKKEKYYYHQPTFTKNLSSRRSRLPPHHSARFVILSFPFSVSGRGCHSGWHRLSGWRLICRKTKRRGNNPYGARGKLRCIHCQESRRKVTPQTKKCI
jgi:hypothetical protein